MVDAETGQRGYLITNQPFYLVPYQEGRHSAYVDLAALADLLPHTPANQSRMQRIQLLTQKKLGELALTVALQKQKKFAEAQKIVDSNVGITELNQIRVLMGHIEHHYQHQVRLEQRLFRARLRMSIILWVVFSIGFLVLFGGFYRVLRAELKRRQIHEDRMYRLAQFNAALAQANQIIPDIHSETIFAQDICRFSIEYGGCAWAWIGCWDDRTKDFVILAESHAQTIDQAVVSECLQVERAGPAILAYQEDRPVFLQDLKDNTLAQVWCETVKRAGLRSCAATPIHRRNTVHAILMVYHRIEQVFDHDLQLLLRELALDVGNALGRLDQKRELEQQQMAAAFEKQRFEDIFRRAPNGIALTALTAEGEFLNVNPRLCALLGYDEAALTQRSLRDTTHPDDWPLTVENRNRLLRQEVDSYRIEKRYLHKDGSIVWASVTASLLRDGNDQPVSVITQVEEIGESRALIERIQRLAFSDLLTSLPNRSALLEYLPQAMARSQRDEQLLAVGFLDLNDFKPINDQYGHATGDYVLQQIAKRLSRVTRITDYVARLGGDEFVLVWESVQSVAEVLLLLDRVQMALQDGILLPEGVVIHVSASCGVTIYPFDEADPGLLLAHADQAMYAAKLLKSNNYEWFKWYEAGTAEREGAARTRMSFASLIPDAVEVYYQPILDLQEGRVFTVEALARLRVQGRLVLPGEFLPGLDPSALRRLSFRVMEIVFAQLKKWDALGLSLAVSLNWECGDLFDPSTPGEIAALLERHDLAARRVVIEILEDREFGSLSKARERLAVLASMGLRIALDDFGSAYASLVRLKSLAIDEIKLDQAIVMGIERRVADLFFVHGISGLAKGLSVDLIVEGVECPAVINALRTLGVRYIQGYAFAKPLPPDDLRTFLNSPVARWRPPADFAGEWMGIYALHMLWMEDIYSHEVTGSSVSIPQTLLDGVALDAPLRQIMEEERHVLAVTPSPKRSAPAVQEGNQRFLARIQALVDAHK